MVWKLFASKKAKSDKQGNIINCLWSLSWSPPRVSLDPLLFLIYINDIGDKLLSLSVTLCRWYFLRVFKPKCCWNWKCYKSWLVWTELNTWSTKWFLSFNPDKADIMVFSNTDVGYNLIFSLNGNNIPITTNHKHLGVTLSSDAEWNIHT
jgi:hypothetical protein